MFKKIKSTKTTKKLPETIDLSWEAHEKFQAKIREELKKKRLKIDFIKPKDRRFLGKLQNKAACKIMRGAR